ncbi:MAG: glk [Micavibrio sp.]|nr:glk [Micavibrio sp.]
MSVKTGLIADIGATNARFALCGADGVYRDEKVYKCTAYPGLAAAAQAYLAERGNPAVHAGAIAVAGPVIGDIVAMTNHPWTFSVEETRLALGLSYLQVMNDFEAVALGVPHLAPDMVRPVGPATAPVPNGQIGIIGPGTGLGVASLIWTGDHYMPVPGEGGHVTAAARTQREFDVLVTLKSKYRHVSAERVCSGKGLVNIYDALRILDSRGDLPDRSAEEISKAALDESDALCIESLDIMLDFMGNVARNIALTLGTFGGIYIAGGICLQLGEAFFTSGFRENFEGDGRYVDYLKKIPTFLILHPFIALVGLSNTLSRNLR